MPGHCPLCLKDLKEPVCIPCGHVYCSACIGNYATGHDKLTFKARCPLATCRQDFNLFIPDINTLPKKFRTFMSQPMRRVHLSTWGSEEQLEKERDQYKQLADNMRIANASLDARAQTAEEEAAHYKRLVEDMKRKHDEERKNLEARVEVLEGRLAQAASRTQRVIEAAVDDSPHRPVKRRRVLESFGDENTLIGTGSYPPTPMDFTAQGKEGGASQGSRPKTERSSVLTEAQQAPKTPSKPWLARRPNTPSSGSSKNVFRFAFRAPSASLLALRGPPKRMDYLYTAPKF